MLSRQETNARDTEVVFCISWFKTHLQVLTLPWSHPEIASIICDSPTGHPAGAQVGRGHVFQSCEQDPEALAAPVQFLTQVSEGFAGSLPWAVF